VKYSVPNNMRSRTPLASYYIPYQNPFQQYPSVIKTSTSFDYDRKLRVPNEKEKKQQDDDLIGRWNKKFRESEEFLDHIQNFSNRIIRRFPNNMTITPYALNNGGIINTEKYSEKCPPIQSKNLVTPAFKAIVCDQCVTIKALTPDTYKQTLNLERPEDLCSPERLRRAQQLTPQERAEQVVELHKILPEAMMAKVKEWTANKPYLLAAQYPHPLEDCPAELTATRMENKWYLRALIDGVTMLSDEELFDFLKKSKGSTCVYIKVILESAVLQSQLFRHKISTQSSSHLPSSQLIQYYWMAVCPFEVLLPFLQV
jgi:hypothetical protein